MASSSLLYGIDKELAAKQASKYDVEREQQAKQWICDVLKQPTLFQGQGFQDALRDGVILTKYDLILDIKYVLISVD
jgi:hypothetical protein